MVDREARNKILQLLEHSPVSSTDIREIEMIRSRDEAVRTFAYMVNKYSTVEIENWKLFFGEDFEFRWGLTKVPWWSLLLIPIIIPILVVLLCFGFLAAENIQALLQNYGIQTNIGTPLFISVMIVVIPTFVLFDWLYGIKAKRDRSVYPFFTRDEYEKALTDRPQQ